MITMTKRFYKTKSAIEYPGLLGTFGEAIEAAKLDIAYGKRDTVYIVEVVAIVSSNNERRVMINNKIHKLQDELTNLVNEYGELDDSEAVIEHIRK